MNTRIEDPTEAEAQHIRDALGDVLDLLLEDGANISAIGQIFMSMGVAALCHAVGPQQAAQYLRELAEVTAAQGHRYAATMGGGEH